MKRYLLLSFLLYTVLDLIMYFGFDMTPNAAAVPLFCLLTYFAHDSIVGGEE